MFTRKTSRGENKPGEISKPELENSDLETIPMPSEPIRMSTPLKGSSQMVPSVIGEDLTVEGNIISKGEVQLEGEIKGDVHCSSLVIGDKALVEGGVVAEDVIVRGRVVGSIRGHRVTLQSSSHVDGDIFHQSLAIEQGAYFEGKSRRSDDPIADAKAAKAGTSGVTGLSGMSASGPSSSTSTGSTSSGSTSSGPFDSSKDTSSKSTRAAE